MRKNLLKQLFLALLLTVAVQCVKAQIAHVGDILCTTGVYETPSEYSESGLEAMGVIFYVDATGQHGWAVALEDAGNYNWANNSRVTPLPKFNTARAAIYDMDGFFNTQEVLNFKASLGSNSNITFPAFEALDFENGWYLPAIGQLNCLFGNIVEVNAALLICGGAPFNMISNWSYWSSTEYSTSNDGYNYYAWLVESTGKIITSNKMGLSHIFAVRGVRDF